MLIRTQRCDTARRLPLRARPLTPNLRALARPSHGRRGVAAFTFLHRTLTGVFTPVVRLHGRHGGRAALWKRHALTPDGCAALERELWLLRGERLPARAERLTEAREDSAAGETRLRIVSLA